MNNDWIRPVLCQTDGDYAAYCLFFLKHQRELYPDITAYGFLDMFLTLICHGRMIAFYDQGNEIVAVVSYYYGTRTRNFHETDIAFVDHCLSIRSHRHTFTFLRCLRYLVRTIAEENPAATVFQLSTFANNPILNRLYSKFARIVETFQDERGTEFHLYSTPMSEMLAYVAKFDDFQ